MLEVEQTKQYINTLKEQIDLKKKLERLQSNTDFKEIITDNYLNKFIVTSMKASVMYKEHSEDFVKEAEAAAKFNYWLQSVITQGTRAEEELPKQEQYLIELQTGAQ